MIYELYVGRKLSTTLPKKLELKSLATDENLELQYLLLFSQLPKSKKIYIFSNGVHIKDIDLTSYQNFDTL